MVRVQLLQLPEPEQNADHSDDPADSSDLENQQEWIPPFAGGLYVDSYQHCSWKVYGSNCHPGAIYPKLWVVQFVWSFWLCSPRTLTNEVEILLNNEQARKNVGIPPWVQIQDREVALRTNTFNADPGKSSGMCVWGGGVGWSRKFLWNVGAGGWLLL